MTEALTLMALRYGLVLVRVSACLAALPILGQALSLRLRAAFAMILALVLVWNVPEGGAPEAALIPVALGAAGEAIIGFAIGTCARLTFTAAEFAGQIIGVPMGIGFMQIVDPLSGQQLVATSRFLLNLTVLVYLIVGGHHIVIRALATSFTAWPVGAGIPPAGFGQSTAELGGAVLRAGVTMAAPALVALLGVKMGLGIIARSAPRVQVFFIGFSLAILVGTLVLIVTMPEAIAQMVAMNSALEGWLASLLESVWTGR